MQFFAWCMVAAGIGMGLGSFGTGIGQGLAVKSAVEGVSRNPGASGKTSDTTIARTVGFDHNGPCPAVQIVPFTEDDSIIIGPIANPVHSFVARRREAI